MSGIFAENSAIDGRVCVGEYAPAVRKILLDQIIISRREDMIAEGFRLMFVGMGIVFIFLVLMVLLMNGAAKFFETSAHWFEEEEQVVAPRQVFVKPVEDELTSVAVAIAAAESCSN